MDTCNVKSLEYSVDVTQSFHTQVSPEISHTLLVKPTFSVYPVSYTYTLYIDTIMDNQN